MSGPGSPGDAGATAVNVVLQYPEAWFPGYPTFVWRLKPGATDPEQIDIVEGYAQMLTVLGAAEKVVAFVHSDMTEHLQRIVDEVIAHFGVIVF